MSFADLGDRLMSWLGSARNIVGCVGGLAGLALAATGLVEAPYWPLATGALYAAGALLAPGLRARSDPARADGGDAETASLRAIVDERLAGLVGPSARAEPDVVAAARDLVEALHDLFDRPDLLRPGRPQTHAVERIVRVSMPDVLDAYLALPRLYAMNHRLADGRTPHQVAVDDLGALTAAARGLAGTTRTDR